jgi:hypothetical protein
VAVGLSFSQTCKILRLSWFGRWGSEHLYKMLPRTFSPCVLGWGRQQARVFF